MKVKIEYTIEVDDDFRRGINMYYDKPGLATRQEVKDWFRAYGESMDDEISWLVQKTLEIVSRQQMTQCEGQ